MPHSVICLYVMAIRPRMDFRTGKVGVKVGISWQALTEWLYVEPHQGIKSGSPGKEQVRRAAATLERAGLLRIASNNCNKQLIFHCILANTDNNVQNKADTKPTRGEQVPEPFYVVENQKADTHPLSGINQTKPTTPTPPVVVNNSKSETPNQHPRNNALIYQNLHASQINGIEKRLHGISDEAAQTIVDELVANLATKEIKNPVAYIGKLAEKHRAGEFVSEVGWKVKEGRERQARMAEQRKENESKILSGIPALPHSAGGASKRTAAGFSAMAILRKITGRAQA